MQNRRRFMVAFGARIRERRTVRDLTLESLARRAGLTKGYLSQIENGHSQPTAQRVLGLSVALGVTADWLLSGDP